MIKKFNEFIKEGEFNEEDDSHYIFDVISREDIEDQFLRLKEVFNCAIIIDGDEDDEIDGVIVSIYPELENKKIKNLSKIREELKTIENRIRSMYPVIVSFGYGSNDDFERYFEFFIDLYEDDEDDEDFNYVID